MFSRSQLLPDFPQLGRQVHGKNLVYLDNAASTLKLASMTKRLEHYYNQEAANIHRGVHWLSEFGTQEYEKTRDKIQHFIGAKARHEVIITKGTTESINLVAHSLAQDYFKSGDVILLSTMEHHSNIVPWQLAAQKSGATVKEIPIDDGGDIILSEYQKLLENNKVKLVSTALISNALGTVNPIKKMAALAHQHGALFMADAAQAMAHEKVDVQDLGVDFLAFSSHKMFGPYGVGILWGKEEHLKSMPVYQGGGDMIDVVSFEKTTFNDLPHKFEAGTPVIAEVIALGSAIDYLQALDMKAVRAHEHHLVAYAQELLSSIPKLRLIGKAREQASVVSFVIEGVHHQDLGVILDQMGIAVRTGHHCTQPLMKRFGISGTTRASFSLYNNKEEVENLAEGIKKAIELL